MREPIKDANQFQEICSIPSYIMANKQARLKSNFKLLIHPNWGESHDAAGVVPQVQ